MIRVIEVAAGTVRQGGLELAVPSPEGTLRWIDVEGPTPEIMASLATTFALHPLAVEDCLHRDQRPKLEEYPGHLFVVVHAFSCPEATPEDLDWVEVHALLLDRAIITVRDGAVPALETLWAKAAADPALLGRGADWLLHSVCDEVVDSGYPVVDTLSDVIDELETDALEPRSRAELARVFKIKKSLALMRRVMSPARDVFMLLSRRGDPRISERTALYFRDIYDHVTRMTEQMDTLRDFTSSVLELYLSSASHRTNEIMRRLTILSAIFLPLGFIVGFFGQNFSELPFDQHWMYVLMFGLVAGTPVAMLAWFRRLGWIGAGRGRE